MGIDYINIESGLCFHSLNNFIEYSVSKSATATAPAVGDGSSAAVPDSNLKYLFWITQNSASGIKLYTNRKYNADSTIGWNGGKWLTPIGNNTIRFIGTYDGNGYTIDGIFIDLPVPTMSVCLVETIMQIFQFGVTNVNITDIIT